MKLWRWAFEMSIFLFFFSVGILCSFNNLGRTIYVLCKCWPSYTSCPLS